MNMGYENLEGLIDVIRRLRAPDGCSWDREQTHKTLRPNMLEEAYEAVDAIDDNDMLHLKEELGDVLLQVILHSQIAEEEGDFTIEDVAKGIKDKLIHRHPHVFGNKKVKSTSEILDNWEKLKAEEKPHRQSVLDGISNTQSALISAQKISKRAVKQGFVWPNERALYECVFSEFYEFKTACKNGNIDNLEEEMGDMLFSVVNLAQWHNVDAEQALLRANKKFQKRFRKMEELAKKPLCKHSFAEFEKLWKKAKIECKNDM